MNSEKRGIFLKCVSSKHIFTYRITLLIILVCLSGCGPKIKPSSTQQLFDFEIAGPAKPSIDFENFVKAKVKGDKYTVIPEEVLELTMPAILQAVTKDQYKEGEQYVPYICRISEHGTITLPLVGEIKVAGMTLSQIENTIINEYYPEYAVTRPSVFAKVLEYNTFKVSITGAVKEPGVYELRYDQMSLVNLIMQAGGVIDEGAAIIRITQLDQLQSENEIIKPGSNIAKPIQVNQQIAGNFNSSFNTNNVNSIISKKNNIQLSFTPKLSSLSEGILKIQVDSKLILEQQLDMTDLLQRLRVIQKILDSGKHVPILDIETELSEMAKNIEQGVFNGNNLSNQTRNDNVNIVQNDIFNINVQKTQYSSLAQENNPSNTTIYADNQSSGNSKTLVLPVKGLNIPFSDVVLQDGDSIIVEHLQLPLFSVMGLVNKPGNYEYPPDNNYTLMQALAFSGGLDRPADPRYATIYRLKSDGTIAHAVFQVANVKDPEKLAYAMNTIIKPGDVIVVENTIKTRANTFFDKVVRINIGTYFNIDDLLD